MTNLTAAQLRRALALRENIDALESELSQLFGAAPTARKAKAAASTQATPATAMKKPRRKMSEAAKARIAASARKRWRLAKAAGKRTLGG